MKKAKVIELIEQAEALAFNGSRSAAVSCIEEALAELKAPYHRGDGEQRIQCNRCGSIFDEKNIKLKDEDIEYCPVCGDSGYRMDMPVEEDKPRRETPEEYLARTGELWPDDGAVYFRVFVKKLPDFMVYTYEDALRVLDMSRAHTGFDVKYQIVCATEAGPPPKDWRSEEEKQL